MSESSDLKADNLQTEDSNRNSDSKNLKDKTGKEIALKMVSMLEKVQENQEDLQENQQEIQQSQKNLREDLKTIKEEMSSKTIKEKENKTPFLDRRSQKEKGNFTAELARKTKQGEGLETSDLMAIFGVKESYAYQIVKQLKTDHDHVGVLDNKKPKQIVHKKQYIRHHINKWYPNAITDKGDLEFNGKPRDVNGMTTKELFEKFKQLAPEDIDKPANPHPEKKAFIKEVENNFSNL